MDRYEALKLLRGGPDGIQEWNGWRLSDEQRVAPSLAGVHRAIISEIDLSDADLRGAELAGVVFTRVTLVDARLPGANLTGASLGDANLNGADLSGADLSRAALGGATLIDADLSRANLTDAFLQRCLLLRTNLRGATLHGANLQAASVIEADLREANINNCSVYGISAWNLNVEDAEQQDLVISASGEATITVDNLEVAQFIYLLLHNEKIRGVIDTITSKVVLILGRFTPERKPVLDAIRAELRNNDYCPVMFDFDKPASRSFTETVRTLAHMARFVIADITDAKSIPQELQAIVPTLRVPVQPLLQSSEREYGMFTDFRDYSWVLPVHRYDDDEGLLRALPNDVIAPAEAKAKELERK